ncbi:MAG: type III secretion system outer membrane ring subunit SctC [Planctomycetaceae bacterium]|nr:type III secretion system outer membrane ring subunit SctC [Planctomycetaceae bacterium]
MPRGVRQGCLLLIVLLLPAIALAEEVPWRDAPYSHLSQSEPLPDLIRSFAADQGIPVVISENVTGIISGRFGPLPPQQFLQEITAQNGLIWYYDGAALYVYVSGEIISRLVPFRGQQLEEVIQTLDDLGVISKRYPMKVLSERGLVLITGPPRYVEMFEEMATGIQLQAERQASIEVTMRVYPLQYAWADDRTFVVGSAQITVPGVATILNNVVNQSAGPGGVVGSSVQQIPRNLGGLRGTGLISIQNQAIFEANQAAVNAQIAAAEAEAQATAVSRLTTPGTPGVDTPEQDLAAAIQPVIQPDPRLNAIIIRDVKQRHDDYARIIAELDRPDGLVQIEASIIDVNADSGFEWGPPFDALWRHNGNDLAFNYELVPGDSANFTVSLLRNGVTEFLTNVKALETEGHARFVARPTVLTINNVEAVLNNQEEFFVRVAGNQQTDLFNVLVGTTLRIVPHIVEENGCRKIKLIIHIEDGQRNEAANVDDIPVVSRNSINTQAVLNEGSSLLIGGLFRDETIRVERRPPLIGRIPKIGKLLSNIEYDTRRMQRIVLITPQIIELPVQIPGEFCPPSHDLGVPMSTPQELPAPITPTPLEPPSFEQTSSLPGRAALEGSPAPGAIVPASYNQAEEVARSMGVLSSGRRTKNSR